MANVKRMKNRKQRPRRTFYEPDQQYIVDWLDNQQNLGTSLQLIITDAIHRYGDGDVIEQYIASRNVADEFERRPATDTRKQPQAEKQVVKQAQPKQQKVKDTDVEKTPVSQPKAQSVETVPKKRIVTPAPQKQDRPSETTTSIPKQAQEGRRVTRPAQSVNTEQSKPKQAPTQHKKEYNPLDVMMEDIDSKFS